MYCTLTLTCSAVNIFILYTYIIYNHLQAIKPIIVIPTYNEKENIARLIYEIFKQNIIDLEIIIVDDNSPDKTAEIAEEISNSKPVHIIKRPCKMGLGSAYLDGFKKALQLGATHIFEMDADFSHNPKDISRLLESAKVYDLVIGSRKINGGSIVGWNFSRKLMSSGAMWISRLILGLKIKDVTAGFRCYKKEVLEKLDLKKIKSNGYAFQEEMLYRTEKAGFKIKEIPVTFIDRQAGKSKISKKDIIEFFIVLLKLRLRKKD